MSQAGKLYLREITSIAREVAERHRYAVLGTIAEGGSEYAEVILTDGDSGNSAVIDRVTVGVHRDETVDQIRDDIERRVRRE